MKKYFNKSLACLIAVLIVISTLPFSALTAEASTKYTDITVLDYNSYTDAKTTPGTGSQFTLTHAGDSTITSSGIWWTSSSVSTSHNTYINGTEHYFKVDNCGMNINFPDKGIEGSKWTISAKYALKSSSGADNNSTVVGFGTDDKSTTYASSAVASANLVNITKNGNIYFESSSTSSGTISDITCSDYNVTKTITLSYDDGTVSVLLDGVTIASKTVSDKSLYQKGPSYLFMGESAEGYLGGNAWPYNKSVTNTGLTIMSMYLYEVTATAKTKVDDVTAGYNFIVGNTSTGSTVTSFDSYSNGNDYSLDKAAYTLSVRSNGNYDLKSTVVGGTVDAYLTPAKKAAGLPNAYQPDNGLKITASSCDGRFNVFDDSGTSGNKCTLSFDIDNLVFDKYTSTSVKDADDTAFYIFTKDLSNSTSGINGWKKITSVDELKAGEKYIIAYLVDGVYYVSSPNTGTDTPKGKFVGKVVSYDDTSSYQYESNAIRGTGTSTTSANSFSGSEESLSNALFNIASYTSSSRSIQFQGAGSTTTYINPDASIGYPSTSGTPSTYISSAELTDDGAGDYAVFRITTSSRNLSMNSNYYMDNDENGTSSDSLFCLFVADEGNTTSGIIGYKRIKSISEISSGQKVLIAHPSSFTDANPTWYVMYPTAQGGTLGNYVAKVVTSRKKVNVSGTLSTAYTKGVSGGTDSRYTANSFIQLTNDGQDGSFSYGLWQFDVTELKEKFQGKDYDVDSAIITLYHTANSGCTSANPAYFYYATRNNGSISDISTSSNTTAMGANVGSETTGTVRGNNTINYYGAQYLYQKSTSDQTSNSTITFDVSAALRDAIDNGYQYLTIIGMQPVSDSTPGGSAWTDYNINDASGSKPTIAYSISGSDEKTEVINRSGYAQIQQGCNITSNKVDRWIGVGAAVDAEWTLGGSSSGSYSLTSTTRDGTTVYVDPSHKESNVLGYPVVTSSTTNLKIVAGSYGFAINNSVSMYFHDSDVTNNFLRFNGNSESSISDTTKTTKQTNFTFFERDPGNTTSGIFGYKKVTTLQSGHKYLIAHPDSYDNPTTWYLLYPNTETNLYSYVAKIASTSSNKASDSKSHTITQAQITSGDYKGKLAYRLYTGSSSNYIDMLFKNVTSDGIITVKQGSASFALDITNGKYSSSGASTVTSGLTLTTPTWHYGASTDSNYGIYGNSSSLNKVTYNGTSLTTSYTGLINNGSSQWKNCPTGASNDANSTITVSCSDIASNVGVYDLTVTIEIGTTSNSCSSYADSFVVSVPIKLYVYGQYDFVKADKTTTSVTAYSYNEALMSAPANSNDSFTHIANTQTHTRTSYSWPTTSSSTTINEVGTGKTENCTIEYKSSTSDSKTFGCTKECGNEYTVSMTDYNTSIADYTSTTGASDYATKYTSDSRTAYTEAYTNAVNYVGDNNVIDQTNLNNYVTALTTAKDNLARETYTITFDFSVAGKDNVTATYKYGETVTAPDLPENSTKEKDSSYHTVISYKWDKDISTVTGDTTYTAQKVETDVAHTFEYECNASKNTHNVSCSVCGYSASNCSCDYSTDASKCSLCDGTRTVTITWKQSAQGKSTDEVLKFGEIISGVTKTPDEYVSNNDGTHSYKRYTWVSGADSYIGKTVDSTIFTDPTVHTRTFYETNPSSYTKESCTLEFVSQTGDIKTFGCKYCDYSYTVDMSTYNAAISEYSAITSEKNYSAKYTETSRTEYTTAYTNAVNYVGDNNVIDQTNLNSYVTALTTAKESLDLASYNITVDYKDEDGNALADTVTYSDVQYGTLQTLSIPTELDNDNVYKWMNNDSMLYSTSRTFNATCTEKNSYICYLTKAPSEDTSNEKITLYSVSHKVTKVEYASFLTEQEDKSLTVNIDSNVISFTYNNGNNTSTISMEALKPAFYQVTGFKINGTVCKTGDTVSFNETLDVNPIYSPITDITISSGDTSLVNDASSCIVKWDTKVTAKADDATASTQWLMDGVVVGYGEEFSFRATRECTITHNNDVSPASVEVTPHISYFKFNEYRDNTVSVSGGFNLKGIERESIVDAGFVLKTDRTSTIEGSQDGKSAYTGTTTLTDNWWGTETALGQSKGVYSAKVGDSVKVSDTNEFIVNISRTASSSFIMGAVCYVEYKDGDTTKFVYSPVSIIAYNQ